MKKKTTAPKLELPSTFHLATFGRVNITLVGVGGTGSHIASGLASLALELEERGISTAITFIDPDRVEKKNVGRQLFAPAEVGLFKAEAVAKRLNTVYGLKIGAACRAINKRDTFVVPGALNVVIGTVDNFAARKLIAQHVDAAKDNLFWVDAGNEYSNGQVLIGNCSSREAFKRGLGLGLSHHLPAPHIVYPDLIQTTKRKAKMIKKKKQERDPSCAELAAEGLQGLFVNRMAAAWSLAMLSDLLLLRELKYFGVAFDLEWGGVKTYRLDRATIEEVFTVA